MDRKFVTCGHLRLQTLPVVFFREAGRAAERDAGIRLRIPVVVPGRARGAFGAGRIKLAVPEGTVNGFADRVNAEAEGARQGDRQTGVTGQADVSVTEKDSAPL